MMAMSGWWVVADVVAACGAVRAVGGFATLVMLIFGGWPETFVRLTSAV